MPLSGGTRVGPYEIVAPLGAGGMGEVYRARDTRLGRDVALKILPPDLAGDSTRKARFDLEARAVGTLHHPNVVVLHDVGTDAGISYMVSELIEGESLRGLIARGPVPPRKAAAIAAQIAEGLSAAHLAGLVHRDLKPANVMLTGNRSPLAEQAKILDFGLARQVAPVSSPGDSTLTEGLTTPGMVMGTVGYMAPEQVRGQEVDGRADIFSLGLLLYELLSGKRAFPGPSSVEILHAILNEEPPDLPAIPPALHRILRRCLEKDPRRRYQNASDLAFALREWSELSTSSHAAQPTASPSPRTSRRWIRLAAATALIAAAGAISWWWARPSPSQPPSYRQITFQEGAINGARFTSDGQSVVYAASWVGQGSRVYISSLRTRDVRALQFPSRTKVAAVSSKGDLALLLADDIDSRRIGLLARSTLSGETPRDLSPEVTCADWSPDGSEMAVIRLLGSNYQAEYPVGNVISQWQGRWGPQGCRISPDGTQLAFVEREDLMIAGRGSRSPKILKKEPSIFGEVTWTPDGKELWYSSGGNVNALSIRALNLRGEDRLIAQLPGSFEVADISREGKVLLVEWRHRNSVFDLAPGSQSEQTLVVSEEPWVVTGIAADGRSLAVTEVGDHDTATFLFHTDGQPPVRVAGGMGQSMSPDGRWIAVWRGDRAAARTFIVPVGAGEEKALRPEGITAFLVSWFSDSRRFLASGLDPDLHRHFFTGSVEKDPLTPVAMSQPELAVGRILVSPDGSRWVGQGIDRKWRVQPVGPGEPVEIPGLESASSAAALAWTPDGQSIYMQAAEGDNATIHRVNVRTGGRVVVHTIQRPGEAGYPLDIVITPDGRYYAYRFVQHSETLFTAENLK